MTFEGLSGLWPAFRKDGSVTAGNASGINDGAAALVLMDEETAFAKGGTPLARILAYGVPEHKGTKPDIAFAV